MAGESTPADLSQSPAPVPAVDPVAQNHTFEMERSDRNFKHSIGKMIVGTMLVAFIIVISSMSYAFVVRGDAYQGTVLETFVKNFSDVMNLLFNTKPV